MAEMKGVILGINPGAALVDISHGVRPQQVEQAAFVLSSASPYFPAGTVHVAVVDPGVGTERLPIVLETPGGLFVGPDNGILSGTLPDEARPAEAEATASLPDGFTAHVLAEGRFQRQPVSATFHGRDIFAPAAAHLSLGASPAEFGPALTRIIALPPFSASEREDGSLAGRVIHVDHFGNLVTTVGGEQIAGRRVIVEIAGRQIKGLSSTYAGGRGLMALVGSRDRLEIALTNGSAAAETGADIGTPVIVSFG